jgi:hypothetical protein
MKSSEPPQPSEHSLDEALEETFPASDPPANTVETGIMVNLPQPAHEPPPPAPDAPTIRAPSANNRTS